MSDELENLKSHGGSRAGSGRKRKHDKFGTAIQKAETRIADRLPELIDRMFELASGVWAEEQTLAGRIVYQRPPDYKAASYLIDRIMGKPTERKEHTFPKPLEEMTDDELRAIIES
jgi:hypothetical protein